MLIPQRYLPRFNVKKEVDLILEGATKNGVFGESLLTLTKESSKCDITKIELTASIIAGLATKGKIAAMQYESLTDPTFDMIAFEADFAAKLLALEKKKEETVKECYDNIDRFIQSDVNYLSRRNYKQFDSKTANRYISEFLQRKYFWIPFYVISLTADEICIKSKQRFWAKDEVICDLMYINKEKRVFSYVLIGHSTSKDTSYAKIHPVHFFNQDDAHRQTRSNMKYEHRVTASGPTYIQSLTGVCTPGKMWVQTLSKALLYIAPCYKGIVSYPSKSGTMQIRDVKEINFNNDGLVNHLGKVKMYYGWLYGIERPPMRVIGLNKDRNFQKKCSLDCKSNGECNFLPHSTNMFCLCNSNFYGTNCELSIEQEIYSNDLNKLLKVNIRLNPTNSALKTELQKLENSFNSQLKTSSERSKALNNKIGGITTNLVDSIKKGQQWQGLVIQYADVIQDLHYYYHVMLEYDKSDVKIESDPFLKEEKLSFAKFLVNPDKLEKNLQMVNYLFLGRYDTPLVNHRSLMFEEMENYKADVCSDKYKVALNHAYDSLSSLQLQGYTTYLQAFRALGVDSSTIVRENDAKVIRQKKYLDDVTCNIDIPHSNLENCKGGYYVYSGMKIDVVCKDSFHLKGYNFCS